MGEKKKKICLKEIDRLERNNDLGRLISTLHFDVTSAVPVAMAMFVLPFDDCCETVAKYRRASNLRHTITLVLSTRSIPALRKESGGHQIEVDGLIIIVDIVVNGIG